MINGYHQLFFGDAQFLGDHFPSEENSLFFEIISKTKVAHHFKECVVARSIADIIKVIVLTTGAHTFLGCGGTRVTASFHSSKEVFKLYHP